MLKRYKLKYFSDYNQFTSIILEAYNYIADKFAEDESSDSHSLDHTIRVANTCIKLTKKLGGAIDVVIFAALFHDVGRIAEKKTGKCHAEVSAAIVSKFLKKKGLEPLINEVSEAILSHRYSKEIEPKTKEAKILQDADALDALGSIGLYRTISYSIENKRDLKKAKEHFHEKLFKLPSHMHFRITKKLAHRKCAILKSFISGLDSESIDSDYEKNFQQIKNINRLQKT